MSTPAGRSGLQDENGFVSKLGSPRKRFLAAVVDHALTVGRRSAKDFLRHFPPRDIMTALRDQPRLRAKLLVSTTGINEKIALKKTHISAAEDLDIALAEQVAVEEDIVALFHPDDRVRFLDHVKLWAFVSEGAFWRISAEGVSLPIAKEHVAFILSQARHERLLSPTEIIDGVSLQVLVESLPKEDLGRIIEHTISEGRAGRVLKEEGVADLLPGSLLVEHISLAHLWERLIADKLSFTQANVRPSLPPVAPPPAPSSGATSSSATMTSTTTEDAKSLDLSNEEGEIVIAEDPDADVASAVDAMIGKSTPLKSTPPPDGAQNTDRPPPPTTNGRSNPPLP